MTVKEVYRNFLLQVQDIYPLSEATVITDWIFESLLRVKKADLIKNPTQLIGQSEHLQIAKCLEQLLEHKPVQYVLGEAWFYQMKLKVNEHVLIPRPETEELVEWVLTADHQPPTTARILDIGTGSGCIAIALRKHLAAAVITAIDISKDAIAIAKENAITQKVSIDFKKWDFLDKTTWKNLPMFDIIISNPPYIPLREKENMSTNVIVYEPHSALFVPDDDALLFYENIAAFGKEHLNYNGKVFVEVHENYAQKTAALFKAAKYMYVDIKQDMFGKERMIQARY
jgi:release factor glutamine methyltransferase